MSFFNQIGTGISRKNQFANDESDDDDSADDLDISMKNSNVKKRKLEDSQQGSQVSKFNFKPRSNSMPQENGENFQNDTSFAKKQYKATLVQSKLPTEETMDPFITSTQTNFSKSVTEFNPPKFKTVATKESEAGAYYNIQNHPTAIMPKSSLAGLPSMIPSKPLKENKSKHIPNYKRKLMKNKEEDEEESIEVQESSGYRGGYQNAMSGTTQKSSLAGLPNSIPSRPLKENKYKPIPNYKRKFMKNKEYEEEEESFDENPQSHPKTCAVPPNQFRTANHQLASNVLRKNGFQRKPDQPATCNSSFKSPLLRYAFLIITVSHSELHMISYVVTKFFWGVLGRK